MNNGENYVALQIELDDIDNGASMSQPLSFKFIGWAAGTSCLV